MRLPAALVGKRGKCPKCSMEVLVTDRLPEQQAVAPEQTIKQVDQTNPNLVPCTSCGVMVAKAAPKCLSCGVENPSGLEGKLIIRRSKGNFMVRNLVASVYIDKQAIGQVADNSEALFDLPMGTYQLNILPELKYNTTAFHTATNIQAKITLDKNCIVSFPMTMTGLKQFDIEYLKEKATNF